MTILPAETEEGGGGARGGEKGKALELPSKKAKKGKPFSVC